MLIPYSLDQTPWLLFFFTAQSCVATIRERRLLLIQRQTTTLGTSEVEEAGPFVDIADDKHELDENNLVLEDC